MNVHDERSARIVINDAARKGVSIGRFRISKAQGEKIKRLEAKSHDLALAALSRMLRLKS